MRRTLCFLAVVALLGCDNDPPPPPTDAMVMRRDTGPNPMPDGSVQDGGPDAGPPADGGTDAGMDAGTDGGPPPMVSCTVLDDPPIDLGLDRRDAVRPVAVAPGTEDFGLAWLAQESVADDVRFLRVGSTGAAGTPITLSSPGLTAGRASLTRFSDGRFLVGWTDNSLGNFEVTLHAVSATGSATGSPRTLTANTARDADAAIVATGADRALVAWVRSDAIGGTADGFVQAVNAEGVAAGAAAALGGVVDPLTLIQHSVGTTAYWQVGNRAQSRRVGDTGFSGTTERLDTEENVIGNVVAARAGSQLAAAFPALVGVRSELRYRPLDDNGSPRAPERVITPAPEEGLGVAIGSLGGGSVVAYRSRDAGADDAVVRLRFLTDLGETVGSFDVADTTTAGGTVGFGVAGDGRMLVAWGTEETDGIRNRAARVECSDAF